MLEFYLGDNVSPDLFGWQTQNASRVCWALQNKKNSINFRHVHQFFFFKNVRKINKFFVFFVLDDYIIKKNLFYCLSKPWTKLRKNRTRTENKENKLITNKYQWDWVSYKLRLEKRNMKSVNVYKEINTETEKA